MGRFLTSPKAPWLLSGLLLTLLVLLASLQYRWTGELSRAERDGKASALSRNLELISRDFDRQLMLIVLALQMGGFDPASVGRQANPGEGHPAQPEAQDHATVESRLAANWRTWQQRSDYPHLIERLYWAASAPTPAKDAQREQTLLQLDRPTSAWRSVPWPAHLPSLAPTEEGTRRFGRRLSRPQRRAPRLLEPRLPGLVLPLWTGLNPSSSRRLPPPSQSLIVELDRQAMYECLADLVGRYLGQPDGGLEFHLRLLDSDSRELWSLGPDSGRPEGFGGNDIDGQSPLFRLRPLDELAPHEDPWLASILRSEDRPWRRPPATATTDPSVVIDDSSDTGLEPRSVFPRWRAMLSLLAGPREGAWTLQAVHAAGSLDAAVDAARRRNLWLSGGVLSLLTLSLGLLLLSTRRAQQLARQQMEFVAGVTHELMTPLAALRSAGQNLADGVVTDAGHVARYGQLVDREGRRLSTMVAQILELSGMHSGHQSLHLAPVHVAEVIDRALADCRRDLEAAGMEVERHDETLPVIGADGDALQRTLVNLIQNAVKYAAEGGWLRISSHRHQRWAEIQVDDRGPGIDAADLPHLFEPFRRGRRMAASSVAGSGLGLSLVKSTVEAHGGEVTAQNRRHPDGSVQGARLIVRLPLSQPLSMPSAMEAEP